MPFHSNRLRQPHQWLVRHVGGPQPVPVLKLTSASPRDGAPGASARGADPNVAEGDRQGVILKADPSGPRAFGKLSTRAEIVGVHVHAVQHHHDLVVEVQDLQPVPLAGRFRGVPVGFGPEGPTVAPAGPGMIPPASWSVS